MKVERLVSMILILLEKERIGAQELAALFEVSTRTVYRDMDAISRAGIPVCSTSGVGGGFEIMRNYKINQKVFSTADLSAILLGLSGLSSVMQGNECRNALAKVRSFIPTDSVRDIEFNANQIGIDPNPWVGCRDIRPLFETLKTALRERELISFDYADRYGNKTARTVEPYQLILKGSHWYCRGYCRQRSDFRLFKLTRISNLRIQMETFTPRDYPTPPLDFSGASGTLQTEITLRIHRTVMDRVLEYCSLEHFSPDGADHYLVRFPFWENDYSYDILFSFGNRCECLEPLPIRLEMKRRIHELAALYETEPREQA